MIEVVLNLNWEKLTLRCVLGAVQESSGAKNRSNESEDAQTNHQRNTCHRQIQNALDAQTHHQHRLEF